MELIKNKILFVMFGYNQKCNIDYAYYMKEFCDDFIYIDSYSNDGSDILLKNKNIEVAYKKFIDWPTQRNYSYEIARKRNIDWLFILDADEMITQENLKQLYNYKLDGSSYICSFDYHFDGCRLKFSGHRPRIRLVNINKSHFVGNKIQEYVVSTHKPQNLRINRLIYNNDRTDFNTILLKQINRAGYLIKDDYNLENIESSFLVILSKKIFKRPTFFKALIIFIYNYIIRLAFLDGNAGFKFCFANSFIFHISIAANEGK